MPRSDVQSPGEKRIIEGLAIVLFDKIADLARSTTLPKLLLFSLLSSARTIFLTRLNDFREMAIVHFSHSEGKQHVPLAACSCQIVEPTAVGLNHL